MRTPITLLILAMALGLRAQTISNITCTNALAQQVMKGQYDPALFAATSVISDHAQMLCELRTRISSDTLKSDLELLQSFGTRHTYSDTLSAVRGIGAARRWAFSEFQRFSADNDGRLIPAYLRFDYQDTVCGAGAAWRDVLAVLPGADTTDKSIVLIEAHLDSRCKNNCDTACAAPGADDNGSGTALVLELARTMSRYTFHRTIVFLLTTGEEQGLIGAAAMAQYCVDQHIAVEAVQNNDIVGGDICGQTSSPPSCSSPGTVDSTQVRIFSNGSPSLPHRGFARTIKMYYQEKLHDQVAVPMTISIIGQEDRTGRGGDHIPFRQHGFRDVRFTSANEDGNASVDSTWYVDRQHTSGDVLGVDTNGDQAVDSFFVDFHYLQRNTLINGMTAVLLALGPGTPDFTLHDDPGGLRVSIPALIPAMAYRIGVCNSGASLDFDAVYRTSDTSFTVPGLSANHTYWISIAAIDNAGVMGPFSAEKPKHNSADTPAAPTDALPFGIDCTPFGIAERPSPTVSLVLMPDPASDAFSVLGGMPDARIVLLFDPLGREALRAPFERDGRVYIAALSPACYTVVLMDAHGNALGRARLVKR